MSDDVFPDRAALGWRSDVSRSDDVARCPHLVATSAPQYPSPPPALPVALPVAPPTDSQPLTGGGGSGLGWSDPTSWPDWRWRVSALGVSLWVIASLVMTWEFAVGLPSAATLWQDLAEWVLGWVIWLVLAVSGVIWVLVVLDMGCALLYALLHAPRQAPSPAPVHPWRAVAVALSRGLRAARTTATRLLSFQRTVWSFAYAQRSWCPGCAWQVWSRWNGPADLLFAVVRADRKVWVVVRPSRSLRGACRASRRSAYGPRRSRLLPVVVIANFATQGFVVGLIFAQPLPFWLCLGAGLIGLALGAGVGWLLTRAQW